MAGQNGPAQTLILSNALAAGDVPRLGRLETAIDAGQRLWGRFHSSIRPAAKGELTPRGVALKRGGGSRPPTGALLFWKGEPKWQPPRNRISVRQIPISPLVLAPNVPASRWTLLAARISAAAIAPPAQSTSMIVVHDGNTLPGAVMGPAVDGLMTAAPGAAATTTPCWTANGSTTRQPARSSRGTRPISATGSRPNSSPSTPRPCGRSSSTGG